MNTHESKIDTKKVALGGLKGAFGIFLKDLNALPDEAFENNFGGKTRTVADIVYEVNLVNDHVGMVMRGEEPFIWPEGGWITAPKEFTTKAVIVKAFEDSSQKILATVEAFEPGEIEAPLETEDGITDRFERCRFMTLHVWYHSGQLNYVQTLLGDDGWHWK